MEVIWDIHFPLYMTETVVSLYLFDVKIEKHALCTVKKCALQTEVSSPQALVPGPSTSTHTNRL